MGITRVANFALVVGVLLSASGAMAETPNADKPMIDHAENAMMQPLKDVNLKKDKIPVRLLEIQKDPYSLADLAGCRAITTEIASLYPMLGPDVNDYKEASKTEKRERGISRVAGGILGSFIPFRGVVRELTGANAAKDRYLRALSAGFARRSFLKGIAVSQGCIKPPDPVKLSMK